MVTAITQSNTERLHTVSETSVVFHKKSNYDHYLIIKQLTEELENQFKCLEENTEKYHGTVIRTGIT